jgi:hypothetical protein
MVPLPVADSFDDLNAQLLQRCLDDDQRQVTRQPTTIFAAWQHEQPLLRPLPARDLPCRVQRMATLTPYSQVVFETNRYSVPVDQAVRHLTLNAYPFHLELLHQDRLLARHPRSYDRDQDIFDPLHYLPLLERRPAAFEHAKPMRRWREGWPLVYKRLLFRLRERWPEGRGVREFVRVLQLLAIHPAAVLDQAIGQALEYGCLDVDGVRLCLHQIQHPNQPSAILDLSQHPQLSAVGSQPVDIRTYDYLLTGDA